MRKIVVTGGAGRLGRVVIDDLLAHGYDVLAVDCVRPEKLRCRFLPADLTVAADVQDVLAGSDAVVHLGAVPGPNAKPASATFQNNVLGTYNVVHAAAVLGLAKVVHASSAFALGWHEDPQRYWPQYAPVDEAHPLTPFEAYGLSKQIGEEICAAESRRTGLATVSLRIMNVIQADGYYALPWPMPTAEQAVRFVMWPYVDVRDAAAACRLALAAPTAGHEAILIAAADIRFDAPTEKLLQTLAPQVEIRRPLPDRTSVISLEKAARILGYKPQYSWQSVGK
jgi:nucleoside-diphosphate-sugar epimerase